MFENIKNILKGTYYNILDINDELCIERMNICKDCKYCKKITNKSNICTLCGCILESKTRVRNEECINGKW